MNIPTVSVIFIGTALLLVMCGVYPWIVNRQARVNRALLHLCLLLALGNLGAALMYAARDRETCAFWYHITWIGWSLYPALALLVALLLTGRKALLRRWMAQLALFAPGVVFLTRSLIDLLGISDFTATAGGHWTPVIAVTTWDIAYSIYQYGFDLAAFLLIGIWSARSGSRRIHRQTAVILIAAVAALLVDALRFYMGRHIPAVATLLPTFWAGEQLLFAAGLSIAVTRYHFIVPTTRLAADAITSFVREVIILTDHHGVILQVNTATMRLTGTAADILVGQPLASLLAEDVLLPYPWSPSQTAGVEHEALLRSTVGKSIPVSLQFDPFTDVYGDAVGVLVVGYDLRMVRQLQHEIDERAAVEAELRQARDELEDRVYERTSTLLAEITERQRVERDLRESEERFRTIVECFPGAIWMVEADPPYRSLYQSEAIEHITGYSIDDFRLGIRNYLDNVHPDDLHIVLQQVADALEQHLPFQYEYRFRHADGHTIWLLETGQGIYDADGTPRYILGTNQDITAHKQYMDNERVFSDLLHALHELRNELANATSVDELCRQAVISGCARLGFDRLSLWFVAEQTDVVTGSYGIDEVGNLRNERYQRVTVTPESLMGTVLLGKLRVNVFHDAPLRDQCASQVGYGTQMVAALWDGTEVVGTVSADNLLTNRPLTHRHAEILELYAATLGHLYSMKRADVKLRESERRYRTLFENMYEMVAIDELVYDDAGQMVDWVITDINPAFETRFGLTRTDVIGKQASELYGPYHALDGFLNTNAAVDGQRLPTQFESYFPRLGKHCLLSAFPLDDQHFATVAIDITEQKLTEVALREAHQTLHAVIAASPLGIVTLDVDGIVLSCNPAAARILGWVEEDVLGRFCPNIPPAQYDDFTTLRQRILAGEMITGMEVVVKRNDGTTFTASISAGLLTDATGMPTGIVALLADISEEKSIQAQVQAYQEELRALALEVAMTEERTRRRLAQHLHDGISQTLALTKIRLAGLRAKAGMDTLVAEINNTMQLLDQAIQHARMLTFELSPPILYELGLAAAIDWLADNLRQQHGLDVRIELEQRVPPINDDLRALLFMAVREALINVVKHAETQQAVVTLTTVDNHLQITVVDNGAGFDITLLHHAVSRGGGFGLFSIRERLRSLGGLLDITSEPGHGTRVSLVMPLVENTAPHSHTSV